MQQRDARKPEPCPCATRREFRALTPAITFRAAVRASRHRARGQVSRQAGSQGGQGQEFLGVRECLAHIASAHRSQPGNRREFSTLEAVRRESQGRYRRELSFAKGDIGGPGNALISDRPVSTGSPRDAPPVISPSPRDFTTPAFHAALLIPRAERSPAIS